MTPAEIRAILVALERGELDVDSAAQQLTTDDLVSPPERTTAAPPKEATVGDFAVLDHDRAKRCGFAEVVFGQGKTADQVLAITAELLTRGPRVLITRATPEQAEALRSAHADAAYDETARCLRIDHDPQPPIGRVAVVAAGTGDLPVAAEAEFCLRAFGIHTQRHIDVGVAGLHRLLARLPQIRTCDAVIAIAGMEGALASVLAGQLATPVFAVPTSVGYGANFEGLAALLSMLNACAAGVGVVNIDAGFSAAYLAALVVRGREA